MFRESLDPICVGTPAKRKSTCFVRAVIFTVRFFIFENAPYGILSLTFSVFKMESEFVEKVCTKGFKMENPKN
ncbi:hypothetical protein [Leptospira kirschneri]|uniref:hypothetical protein n=1 Tax=Leptospira kirschneri TaxID=29507 RepID=UPI0020C954A6|nr:hypothetical protein [Leptospira kirschneri]